MIVISDIHGCYGTLRRLLRKCPDEEIIFLGDLIDRGPDSASVVRFAMDQKIPTVCGNHEEIMLAHLGKVDGYQDGVWLMNGGYEAMKSFGGDIPESIATWAESLPLFIEREGLLLSHTGHGKGADCRESALWCRDWLFPKDGLFRVFGHTPQKRASLIEDGICIDTGAAYLRNGYGHMTAFQWPQVRVFTQSYDESPL